MRFAPLHALTGAALILSTSLPAFADAKGDLEHAIANSFAKNSYHLVIASPRMNSTGDFQRSPLRMKMDAGAFSMLVIGTSSYIRLQNKGWQKVPQASIPDTSMDPAAEMKKLDAYQVNDLGMRSVGGQAYHAYRAIKPDQHHDETVFVDGQGRIARVETGSIMMTFSNFGENVSINPPI